MDSLIFLIVLYIIFSFISSLLGKKKLGERTSQTQKKLPSKDIQASLKKYVAKLEKFLKQPQRAQQKLVKAQPEKVVSSSQEQDTILSRERLLEQVGKAEEILTSTDAELETALSVPSPPSLPTFHLPKSKPPRHKKPDIQPKQSLLSIDKRRGYIQALIMSEILGPPVSKRNQRLKPPR